MPILDYSLYALPPDIGPPIALGRLMSARIRFGQDAAQRLKLRRRPRRPRLTVSLATTSGTYRASLVALTLYGAVLIVDHPLKRREMVALRLPGGGRINTRVRWRLGERTGVQFLCPVADFALLLREIRKAGSTMIAQPSPQKVRHTCVRDRKRVAPLRGAFAGTRRLGRQLLRWCRSL